MSSNENIELKDSEMILNMGPQHPSTHGVLRLELVTDGEVVVDVRPHIGYLHRCFEKHAENLPYNQIIPFTDRLDYMSSMNNNHIFSMGVEHMIGITDKIPQRVEYIRVLVAELNRIASHLIAIGTFGLDIGAFTPFMWCFRDREHIMNLLEWLSGSRMLYNYIWIGGLYYDLPVGFEERCKDFVDYFTPKLTDLNALLSDNPIFIKRTANVGILPLTTALDYGCTGPVLRGSGLAYDLRREDAYSVYPELDFNIPKGEGKMGTLGDCWDRFDVRMQEVKESLHIITQCITRLQTDLKRSPDFDPRQFVPKKIRIKQTEHYVRGESPKGSLGFYFLGDEKSDIPKRCKVRSPCFSNLSVLPEISRGVLIADLVAIVGSLDLVMGEVDK